MTNAVPISPLPADLARGHEPDNVSVRWIAGIGLGLFGMLIITAAGAAFAFMTFVPRTPSPSASQESRRQLMTPGVQANQAYDRERIAAQEQGMLGHYGWQDPEHRVVHIPIQRAMEIMAQRKLQTGWTRHDETPPPVSVLNPAERRTQP